MNTKTVILTTCDDAFKAHVLQGALESEGIESILHNEIACNLMPNMNGIMGMGVQVLVLEEDYEAALKVLEIDQPRDGNKCPYCGSVDIASSLGKRQGLKAFYFLLWQPLRWATSRGDFIVIIAEKISPLRFSRGSFPSFSFETYKSLH